MTVLYAVKPSAADVTRFSPEVCLAGAQRVMNAYALGWLFCCCGHGPQLTSRTNYHAGYYLNGQLLFRKTVMVYTVFNLTKTSISSQLQASLIH